MEESKKARYVKKNVVGASQPPQELKKAKKASPIRKAKRETEETVDYEEQEEQEPVDEQLQKIISNYTSDIDAILMSAHKLSKTQLTKSAPYQPKIAKGVSNRPQKIVNSPNIGSPDGNLSKAELSSDFLVDEIKEIINYLKGDQKKIKSDNWKLFFKKLYNYDPAGLPLKNIKNKVLDRVELLTKVHSIKSEPGKE